MLVFKNGKCKFDLGASNVDCFIESVSDDNASRSDDGSYMSKSYKVLFDLDSLPKITAKYVELQHENYGYLGLSYVQKITYYNLTKSAELLVEIRPHKISKITTSIEFDDFGNPIPQQWVENEPTPCLFKQNTSANKISILEDGVKFTYSYEISLSRDCESFNIGDKVVLYDSNGNVVTRKDVKGFSRQRLNSTLWI